MAESGIRKFGPASNGRQNRQGGTNRFKRSASECRKKRSVKANFHRSRSSQSERQEPLKKDEQQRPQEAVAQSQMEKALLENSSFPNFFARVTCPFCLEVQNSKTELVKHLGRGCRAPKTGKSKFAIFQIWPDDSIKCNVCLEECFSSVEGYFRHLHNDDHILKCSEAIRKGKHLTEFFFCSICYVFIPDNFTQLQCHLENKIHKARSGSVPSADLRTRGIMSVYCILSGKKVFRCLVCAHQQLFYTPLEMINHWKTAQHLRETKKLSVQKVYCCLCKVEFNVYETPFHFTSVEHGDNDRAAGEGRYELCLYCGFSCTNLAELSHHMRVKCDEINKIKGESPEEKPNDIKDKGASRKKEQPRQRSRCILVKDDVDIGALIRILKAFGKIRSLAKYDDEYFIIEYQDNRSVEEIYMVEKFIKVDNKKVCIKFLQEVQGTDEAE